VGRGSRPLAGPAAAAGSDRDGRDLRPHEDGTELRRFPRCEVVTLRGEESRLVELTDLAGVRDVVIDPNRPFVASVTVDDARALIGWLERNERFLVSAVKFASALPNFSGEPSLEPIGTFQAAIELTQELLNRHPGSRLAQEYAGHESGQVADVARMLRGASCFALCPGRLETTLDTLEATFFEVTT